MDDEVWDSMVFCHNRDRLLTHEVAEMFFEKIKTQASAGELLSKEHFSADGPSFDAAASIKSFKRQETNDTSSTNAESDEQEPDNQGHNVDARNLPKRQENWEFPKQ
jgi:hypothetical protein